jgi:hypothetical protein
MSDVDIDVEVTYARVGRFKDIEVVVNASRRRVKKTEVILLIKSIVISVRSLEIPDYIITSCIKVI